MDITKYINNTVTFLITIPLCAIIGLAIGILLAPSILMTIIFSAAGTVIGATTGLLAHPFLLITQNQH